MSLPAPRETRIVGDLSGLPRSAAGPASLLWWGNVGFMLVEGSAFALAAAAYLYLQSQSSAWPPKGDHPPGLLWSTIFTVGLVASALPNVWLSKKARRKNERMVRLGALFMTIAGVLLLIARAHELGALNIHWASDAYGSTVWLLMVLHTSHLATDLGETAVITLWLYTHEVGDDQFADVEDNCNYWTFVVLAWLPIYGLLYGLPRWLS